MSSRTPSLRSRRFGLRAGSALLACTIALQAAQVPTALADDAAKCPLEPKREPKFLSKEWRMAKFADFDKLFKERSEDAAWATAGSLLKTAMSGGSLEDYGMAVVSAVMDSYLPGSSSLLSTGSDPMVEQTKVLLDAIDDLEQTMFQLEGDGWAEFRSAQRDDIQTALETARDGIRNWNIVHGQNGGWSVEATGSLYEQIDRLVFLLNEIETQVKRRGSAADLAPFPFLSLLEVYTEVMQLFLLTNPSYVLRAEANNQGIDDLPSYRAASPATISVVNAMSREGTLGVMEATIDDALAFAQQVAALNPYRERAAWMVSERPVSTNENGIYCDEDTDRVRADAEWVWGLLLSETHSCGSSVGPFSSDCPELPDVAFSYTTKSMNPDYTYTEQHHCIVMDRTGQSWHSTYDGFAGDYASVDEAFKAHQKGTYNALLRVGWGPFGVTLDKWWQALRGAGLRSGLRPTLALDEALDDYLLSATGAGVTTQSAMYIVTNTSNRAPSKQEAALLVGYAIEYGPDALMRLYTDSHASDWFFKSGDYPLDDRLRFVTNVRKPNKMAAYFRSVNAARILPVL
jgi:hypothetical protein